ncbi:MAG: glycosyltransferase, partial [Rhizobiales bacterium]|nr:glycosyltransferase [Hyphomicrobiales bacterium]
ARNILPLIRENLPGARLLIAGRSPTPAITRLAETHAFELIADPPDVAELLARAQIVIVPLEVGGGTRLKILEAMAAGVPVVATPLAAEGLEISDGVHVVLANTDVELAGGVELLCTDTGRWQRQRQSARRLAMEVYGPAAISHAVRRGLDLDLPVRA